VAGERRRQNIAIAAGAAALQATALAEIASAYFEDPAVAQKFMVSAESYQDNPEAFAAAMPEIVATLLAQFEQQQQQEQTNG
jgi:hypothetical protein